MKKWIKEGLVFGIVMFIVNAIAMPLFENEELYLKKVMVKLIIWLIAGVFYGVCIRYVKGNA